ncbi:MAG: hypothetical protein O3C27_02555 [Actinomycetota bacterium]|nr:hypothetical protein [Actinomycetota bacterium]
MRRRLVLLVLAARVLATAALLVGPWTDDAAELAGWDASRFQAIHDAPGRPWIDHGVEYPPGSVALIELITVQVGESVFGEGVVGTQRLLVALSLVVDLGVAVVLERHRRDAGLAYLVLGTAVVPAGLLRFDLWAAACTAIGLIFLAQQNRKGRAHVMAVGGFALAVVAGAAIKISPGLLIAVALAVRKKTEAVVALVCGAFVAAGWLVWAGTDALTQVTSLRGAEGWHVESVPGSLLVLTGAGPARFEADAYRIGTLDDDLVLAGRVMTLLIVVGLGVLVHRRSRTPGMAASAAPLAMLGSTAALVLTAPLLSPQFLLWLTPAAALTWVGGHRRPTVFTAAAIALTALTLALFGPPGVDHPLAAAMLLVRDTLLIGIIGTCALDLRSSQPGCRAR